MLTLIGVAHVFDIAEQVEMVIKEKKPDIICVELDRARYLAIKEQHLSKDVTLPYRLLALFQRRIASKYGIKVGSEMLAALETAATLNIPTEFIDMDGIQIFARLWKSMALSERLRLVIGGFFGLFVRKKRLEEELEKFEKTYDQYMEIFGNAFPTVKKILIDERNQHMANMLQNLCSKYKKVLAVVGEGHVEGLKKLLYNLEPEIIKLSSLRKMGAATLKTTSEVSIGYTLNE
ncbi:MAG: TraB domain-containing protein [Candidatus Thermoplasmatota archaeon]|nr:TraB domain-containing protein [Candidatus Thermoplasmatota archaeon]